MKIEDLEVGMKVRISKPNPNLSEISWQPSMDKYDGLTMEIDFWDTGIGDKPFVYVLLRDASTWSFDPDWLTPMDSICSTDQDYCKCGSVGEMRGMACFCQKCGAVIWGC